MKFRNALIAVLAGIALLVAGAGTIGAQPADDPPPPPVITEEEIPPPPTLSEVGPVDNEGNVIVPPPPPVDRHLDIETRVWVGEKDSFYGQIHDDSFNVTMSYNPFIQKMMFGEGWDFDGVDYRGSVVDTVLHSHLLTHGFNQPSNLTNRIIDSISSDDTCVEYGFSAYIAEVDNDSYWVAPFYAGVTDRTVVRYCPETFYYFVDEELSIGSSSLLYHSIHEVLLDLTMSDASEYVSEMSWAPTMHDDAGLLDITTQVYIDVDINITLVDRNPVTPVVPAIPAN